MGIIHDLIDLDVMQFDVLLQRLSHLSDQSISTAFISHVTAETRLRGRGLPKQVLVGQLTRDHTLEERTCIFRTFLVQKEHLSRAKMLRLAINVLLIGLFLIGHVSDTVSWSTGPV